MLYQLELNYRVTTTRYVLSLSLSPPLLLSVCRSLSSEARLITGAP